MLDVVDFDPAELRDDLTGPKQVPGCLYSAAELKTMQEVITLVVFAGFSVLYLREPLTINHVVGFSFICLGAFFVFRGPL